MLLSISLRMMTAQPAHYIVFREPVFSRCVIVWGLDSSGQLR
jgi:hypothetical protein